MCASIELYTYELYIHHHITVVYISFLHYFRKQSKRTKKKLNKKEEKIRRIVTLYKCYKRNI